MAKEFTAKQLKDYQAYERVRDRGLYNMFTDEARKATRLTKDEYVFVMQNYSELADAAALQNSRI